MHWKAVYMLQPTANRTTLKHLKLGLAKEISQLFTCWPVRRSHRPGASPRLRQSTVQPCTVVCHRRRRRLTDLSVSGVGLLPGFPPSRATVMTPAVWLHLKASPKGAARPAPKCCPLLAPCFSQRLNAHRHSQFPRLMSIDRYRYLVVGAVGRNPTDTLRQSGWEMTSATCIDAVPFPCLTHS